MNAIYLEAAQVPSYLRGDYSGKKFKARIGATMTIPADAGLWSGGTKESFRFIRLADGATVDAVKHNLAPWDGSRRDIPVTLQPGFAVVRHSFFCGKDMGLEFYVHPENAAMLPRAEAPDLDPLQQLVLNYTKSRKASYNGRDRFDMAQDDWKWKRDAGPWLYTRNDWNNAKAELIAAGYLNKAGAITPKGRNVAKSL